MDVYSLITRFFPRKVRKDFTQLMLYSNIRVDPNQFLGFLFLAGVAISLYIAYFMSMFNLVPYVVSLVASFIAVEVLFYFAILLSIDSKAKFVESVLPDALQLMSSNIRAGLTTDKALLMAARPEFGPLAEEIRRVGKETMTGTTLADALMKINLRIKSDNLAKTLDLIVNSIKSGGKLADLLDQTSSDLRDQQIIQKEITASVLLYAIFVFIAIGMGAPLLFSMSSFLVKILGKLSAEIGGGMSAETLPGNAPIAITNISITPEFLTTYSIISLIVSSFFGSLIMGLILKGNAREGLKYAPILGLLSVGLFLAGSFIMSMILEPMMGI